MAMIAAGVGGEKPLHPPPQVTVVRGPKQHVEVVGHQAVAQQVHGHEGAGIDHRLDEGVVITRLVENGLASVTPIQGVIPHPTDGGASSSRHAPRIPNEDHAVNKALCPRFSFSAETVLAQATYTYDALDNRIGLDENGTQTWTLYDGSTPVMDFNGSGSLTMRYLNGPAGDIVDTVLARQSAGGTVAWYLPDRLGTIRDLINNSGSIIDHVDYSAFGTVQGESSPSNGDRMVGFAGMERDTVTGLNLAVHRVENPGTGRWTSQDPVGFTAGDADLYRYVGNASTDATDPGGLDESATSVAQPSPVAPVIIRPTKPGETIKPPAGKPVTIITGVPVIIWIPSGSNVTSSNLSGSMTFNCPGPDPGLITVTPDFGVPTTITITPAPKPKPPVPKPSPPPPVPKPSPPPPVPKPPVYPRPFQLPNAQPRPGPPGIVFT